MKKSVHLKTNLINHLLTEARVAFLAKTNARLSFKRKIQLTALVVLSSLIGRSQTYTTIANGAWSSSSTWQGGIAPPISGIIIAGMTVNIKHVVTYSGTDISNLGTINISNAGGASPRLIVASGINFTNGLTGQLFISGGELRQYRFAGGGESGSSQNGNFTNNGGYVSVLNSFVEIAQSWKNQGGTVVFNNSSLELGQDYSLNAGVATDSLLYTSVSVGMNGNGDFAVTNGKAYFKTLRVEVASSDGQFTLNNGTVTGSIDYIALKNHVTNAYSNNKINVASSVVTTGGLSLNAYCINNPSHFVPNGKLSGTRTPNCSLNYFPAPLMFGASSAKLNFSSDPVLVAGTAKLAGAQYKYESVAPGMDALVSIDSIVNGAVINAVDDNTGANGGYIEAFQPIITSGPAIGSSYAVFTFNYKVTGTSTDLKLDTAAITALDIDGDPNIHEFDQISLGAGAVASYWVANPVISLTQLSPGIFKGIDMSSVSHSGVDTVSKGNMFSMTNTKVSSFTAKLGIVTTTAQQTQRLFSLYAKSFNYPKPITLPVKLIDFTAQYKKPNVSLEWSTAQEHNFSHFILERGVDGTNFDQIAIVFGTGESDSKIDYSYTDKDMNGRGGIIYYRLKQVDIDGSFDYSPVRVIKLGDDKTGMTITSFPNPATNELHVTIPASWQGKEIKYELVNTNGQLIKQINHSSAGQTETIAVNDLEKGMYFVRVNCIGETAIQKIIKN